MQVLDAWHCELYLESKFRDGTSEYEDLDSHFSDGQVDTSAATICNRDHIDTARVKSLFLNHPSIPALHYPCLVACLDMRMTTLTLTDCGVVCADILNVESWIRGRSNLLPVPYHTPVAVALNTNLMPNGGMSSSSKIMS
jgi:hypothetical protein